jgi:aminocarboxymuconate-semialdehyde decarboxylase
MLDMIVDTVGENRVAVGSDYPFPLGEHEPGKLVRNMPWADVKKAKILAANALEWLNG